MKKKWKQAMFATCCMVLGMQMLAPVYAQTQEQIVTVEAPVYYAANTGVDSKFETYLISELKKKKTSIDITAYGIKKDEIANIFYDILNRNPELYFVQTKIQYSYSTGTGVVTTLSTFYYNYDTNAVEREVNKVLALVNENMTDLEKVITIHDYLCMTIVYPYSDYLNNQVTDDAHTIVGALIDKKAVCDGYSTTFQYVMYKLGIPCNIVTGTSDGQNHAWNQIKLDGQWYFVDVTWDDVVYDNLGMAKHQYMLKSENDFDRHAWVKSDYERCTSTKYDNAFWENTDTLILHENNAWYYVDRAGELRKHSLKDISAAGTKVATLGGKWYVFGDSTRYFTGNYTKLAKHNGKIYYSQPEAIYCIDFDGSNKKLFSNVDTTTGYVYGMKIENNKLYYQISKESTRKEQSTYYFQLEAEPVLQKITTGQNTYEKACGDPAFSLMAKTSGNGKLTFTSSNTKVVTVSSDGKVYVKGLGTADITIRAAATSKYKAATKKVTVTVSKKKLKGKIQIPTSKYAYNGKAKKPTVTIAGYKKDVDYKVKYSNNIYMGTGKITVTGIGNYTGTLTRSFYIVPRQVKLVSVTSTRSKTIKVAWAKQNYTGYEIYVCQRKDFAKGYKKITVANPSTLSKTITNLASGKTYYVRVRAYRTINGKSYQGIFSNVLTVRVK